MSTEEVITRQKYWHFFYRYLEAFSNNRQLIYSMCSTPISLLAARHCHTAQESALEDYIKISVMLQYNNH